MMPAQPRRNLLERVTRIELALSAWETYIHRPQGLVHAGVGAASVLA